MWQLIVMFLCGFFLALSIVGLFVTHQLYKEKPEPPTDEEMDQMCLWYEQEYGKQERGKHER